MANDEPPTIRRTHTQHVRRTFAEFASPFDATEKAHRDPRLTQELILLKRFDDSIDDWRKLEPSEVATSFQELQDSDARALLATAVFVGTTQACLQGCYWAPSFGCPGTVKVDCGHVVRPTSCLYPVGKLPPIDALRARRAGGRPTELTLAPKCNAIDAAARLATVTSDGGHQVVLLRFTSLQDPRNETARYSHLREDQLFLRTTYGRAFEVMPRDINTPVRDAIDEGGIIYTSGVGVIRGPLEDGALWFQEPPKVDVIWVGLPVARPQLGIQEQYALEKDRKAMATMLDRAFHCAVGHGADAVVMPPVGCGTHGLAHPRLDVAELIRSVASRWERYIDLICVASDVPAHFEAGWWDGPYGFAQALQNGRPEIEEPPPRVPPICIPPELTRKKDAAALAEKAKKLSGGGRKVAASPRRPLYRPRGHAAG
jgi:hypothetical protein